MKVRHPIGVSHSFSIKNIFYDKTDLRLIYFHVTICKTKDLTMSWLNKLTKKLFCANPTKPIALQDISPKIF